MKPRLFLLRSGHVIETDCQIGRFSKERDTHYLSEPEYKIIFKFNVEDDGAYQCVYFDPRYTLLTPISIKDPAHNHYSDIVGEFTTKEELIAYILLNL